MAEDAIGYRWAAPVHVSDEDESLVARASHDPEAAGRLYDRYYERIVEYIYRCTCDPVLTEDLTANVLLAAFQHLGRFRWRRIPFEARLYRIATNEVRMHLRSQRRIRLWSIQVEDRQRQEEIEGLRQKDQRELVAIIDTEVDGQIKRVCQYRYVLSDGTEVIKVTGQPRAQ